MNDGPFFDTDVILYAFRKDDARSQAAEELLAAGGTTSVQVLNEFAAVARRRLDKNWREIRRALDVVRVFCPEPVALSVEIHERGLDVAERYGYSIFDALVIAAAIHSGAGVLYSEDMRDGQSIEGVTIRNPFWCDQRIAFQAARAAAKVTGPSSDARVLGFIRMGWLGATFCTQRSA